MHTNIKTSVKKCKKLAKFVKKSSVASRELQDACNEDGVNYTKLQNSNSTRWNSTLVNLSSVFKLKVPLRKLKRSQKGQRKTATEQKWSDLVPSNDEFKLIEAMIGPLEEVMRMSKSWESDKEPTMNRVVEKLWEVNESLIDLSTDEESSEVVKDFARLLREKIMGRFPKCGAEELIAAVANYVDPYLKGFHLKELGLFEDTKQKMAEMWPSETDINENTDTENSRMAVCEIVSDHCFQTMSRTEKLMKERELRRIRAEAASNATEISKEMALYEATKVTSKDNKLQFWRKKKEEIPVLYNIAKEILGIPASSASSERIFSSTGQVFNLQIIM